MSALNMPLFCFGTLMDTDILTCVTDLDAESLSIEPASIVAYAQRNVIGENFPVLVPDSSETTRGVLIGGLTQHALDRVLFYEGDEYYLAQASAINSHGAQIDVSVFHSAGIYQTADEAWDFARWTQHEKADFLPRVKRYMQLFGTMTATEADQHW